MLEEVGIQPSVGSFADSDDNALAESIIGLYKTEVIGRKKRWSSLEEVELATLTWVSWFNQERLMERLGYRSPADYEALYHGQETQAVGA